MNRLFSKNLIGYAVIIFLILVLTGGILVTVTDNLYVLLAVLVIEYIILILIIFHFFDKYIKPIDKVTSTMDKLLAGNYHARINQQMNGSIGELSTKINSLARNLSELTISEQIKAEQLTTVIENSESGLVLIDEKGYIHVVNRKFISMFGKTPHDYIGYLYYDVLENEQIHHTVQETFLYEKRVKQLFSIAPNNEKMYLEIVGAPIFNERNMLKGAVLVIYDITEFKNVELMRKDFVANVSHELKTPITSIKGFAETLLDGAAEEKETREQFLQIIFDESKRIQRLVEDLLVLSRLEKDETDLQIEQVPAEHIVEDILPTINKLAEEKQIAVNVQFGEDIRLSVDEEKVKQILVNLLTNAISYTPENGNIKMEITEEGEQTRFQVTDSGIGIEKDKLPRIFERFYRADKDRSRDTGGTGLGLAIVKHIVEVHGGKIDVVSEVGKGTTFNVYLPKQSETA